MKDKIKGYMELMKEPWDHMGHEDLEFCGIKAKIGGDNVSCLKTTDAK